MFTTTQETVEAAVADVLNDDTKHNCARITVEAMGDTFTLEFVDDWMCGINVTDFARYAEKADIVDSVDLEATDIGPNFIVFDTRGRTASGVIQDINDVAEAVGGDDYRPTSVKTFVVWRPTIVSNIKKMLRVGE